MTERPQPRAGDVLLGCVHKPDPHAAHIFQVPDGLPFRRPGGTTDTAKWIVLCERCHTRYGGRASNAPLGCDAVWRDDDEPIKYKDPA